MITENIVPFEIESNGNKQKIENVKSIKYENLVVPLVKSVQEIYPKVVAQDQRIEELERQNAELKAALCGINPKAKVCRR